MNGTPALKNTLDYNAVRIAIVQAIQYVSGLDNDRVIVSEPEEDNEARPDKPYYSFKIIVPGARFGDDDKRNVPDNSGNPTQNWSSNGPRMMTVSFNTYGNSHEEAYNLMALWQAGLDEENTQALLRQSGIGVWKIGSVADLSALLNTGYEGRAQMDVTFGLVSSVTSNLGEIDTVPVQGTVTSDQGEQITISATDPVG